MPDYHQCANIWEVPYPYWELPQAWPKQWKPMVQTHWHVQRNCGSKYSNIIKHHQDQMGWSENGYSQKSQLSWENDGK